MARWILSTVVEYEWRNGWRSGWWCWIRADIWIFSRDRFVALDQEMDRIIFLDLGGQLGVGG